MLQDCSGFVLFDSLWHHVKDIVHYCGTQLEIVVTLHPLLGNRLSHALRVSSFELSGEQVAQPSFQEGYDTAKEEQPYTPAWCPETTAWSFTHRTLEDKTVGIRDL